MDLYNEIMSLCSALEVDVKKLEETGKEYAMAYTTYRMKLRQELLKLKADGMPVTMAYDVARGDKEVARAKFNEISKEAIYKANLESINALKLQIKVLQNQYDKEYSQLKEVN